jgi:hypothetical protein
MLQMETTECCGRPIYDSEDDVPSSEMTSGGYVLRDFYDEKKGICDWCEQQKQKNGNND